MRAAERGFVEAVRMLLKSNAKTNIPDLHGNRTPSSVFIRHHRSASLDILFACISDGTQRQQECFSIIMSDAMANINEASAAGKPLLLAACEKGEPMAKICSMLLERGADVHAIDRATGQTALHAACASGSMRIVRELLQRGADVNARDAQQQTPAHAAVTSNTFEVIDLVPFG